MKQISEFIGGIAGIVFLGAIVFGALKSENTTAIIIVSIIGLIIYIAVKSENKQVKENDEKAKAAAKVIEDIRVRTQKIENMSEIEFISFVKYNYSEYDKYFKNEGVGGKHGVETKMWSTNKYRILSEVDTNNFNDLITVYRKNDGEKIFSGCWGYGGD